MFIIWKSLMFAKVINIPFIVLLIHWQKCDRGENKGGSWGEISSEFLRAGREIALDRGSGVLNFYPGIF